jgi:hypothetical protein
MVASVVTKTLNIYWVEAITFWPKGPPTGEQLNSLLKSNAQVGQRTRLAYLYSTLAGSGVQTARLYDQRGGAETEFRADKSGGGHLHKRRKHKRDAQEVWIHLTDMAHNYFSWFAGHILADSRFKGYGPLRISRDSMRVPGLVEIRDAQLLSVKLLKASPYASDLLACLERFWE